ncbi:asparagine synthase (glutamine-hydrolyzing) [Paraflavisolibacter sp. H34]|uniref:asparagine synthase (glutamine-hydrolyzing) n=1 Tax=Huijunlia imazamoxiresistens TaxID=3127457 RepID=UPI0030180DB9
MCGIAGMVSALAPLVSRQRVAAAAAALQHRGPEDEGLWMNGAETVALGHQRLCIMDAGSRSRQPMAFAGRYVLVHNGELYNYLELKQELERKGYRFTTLSDTEVLVAAYDAWGADCLQRFDGMFAFALWDEQEQELFAARDRLGEKPFFYFYDEDQLVFASEMKALWAAGVPREVNRSLLYNYLSIGYTANPFDPGETFYEGIRRLPAAHFLRYSLPRNELALERYWGVEAPESRDVGDAEAVERLRELLSASVQRRLRSDVATGTSLSGGLDSSLLAALCANAPPETYSRQCFTAVFPGYEKSEERYAAAVASRFGLRHHRVTVDGSGMAAEMDRLMRHQEEPVGSASTLAQYKVYAAAKRAGVTVLLDGQGADELLAGYHKYYKWYWQELYAAGKLGRSGELAAARALGVTEPFTLKNKAAALFPHFAGALLQSQKAREAARLPFWEEDFAHAQKRHLYYSLPARPDLNGVLYYNTFLNGLEELLRYADRNSMAHAVEVRLPFLDHRLVEFLFALPPHLKIRQGWTKWLLRQAAEPMLPQEIVWRKDKVGFEPPQKKWMADGAVQERIREAKRLLADKGIISKKAVGQPIIPSDAHAAGNFHWRFWSASYLF